MSFIQVPTELKGRIQTVSKSLTTHAELNLLAGHPHHFLAGAALAARPAIGESRFHEVLALNRAAGAAKHSFPKVLNNGRVAHTSEAAAGGIAAKRWADVEEEPEAAKGGDVRADAPVFPSAAGAGGGYYAHVHPSCTHSAPGCLVPSPQYDPHTMMKEFMLKQMMFFDTLLARFPAAHDPPRAGSSESIDVEALRAEIAGLGDDLGAVRASLGSKVGACELDVGLGTFAAAGKMQIECQSESVFGNVEGTLGSFTAKLGDTVTLVHTLEWVVVPLGGMAGADSELQLKIEACEVRLAALASFVGALGERFGSGAHDPCSMPTTYSLSRTSGAAHDVAAAHTCGQVVLDDPREGPLFIGATINFDGLRGAANLNGDLGFVVGLDAESGRWRVRTPSRSEGIAVQRKNLLYLASCPKCKGPVQGCECFLCGYGWSIDLSEKVFVDATRCQKTVIPSTFPICSSSSRSGRGYPSLPGSEASPWGGGARVIRHN
mmetsp:Transcript_65971/g.213488  ORF Transcript_65971/g.213488 Transcript_65971/m.213488 type:complete len:491 (-) Transcript_65971:9-1481(-)